MASSTDAGSGRLLGKSAVITGAAAGIGRATAELLPAKGRVLSSRTSTSMVCRRCANRLRM